MHPYKLILLNGPPGSGKDYIGGLLAGSDTRVHLDKFARVVKERTHAAWGLFGHGGAPRAWSFYEKEKDVPHPDFLGRTPRECYIAFSEKLYKPLHGSDVFGRLLLADLELVAEHEPDAVFVITDSGFSDEARCLIDWVGRDKALLVRVDRKGTSFAGDSRGYLSDLGVNNIDLHNFGMDGLLRNSLFFCGLLP